ncbi:MAG: leucine--tRNA ligase [Simkaniaceae bacterium]|nr:leucine--tRNA ligase [Simkaniaceae bacterium]MCF7852905.1 leucine--tRNA ligase [Simkaniaceae bacterium]
MKYDHRTLEKKWQRYWADNKTFKAEIDPSKPKYYILDMFPYPSGAGLHVGHVTGYTATDILARHKRQKGFSVLHPMGWDSFGLPAEQYAIRTGTHPAETTKANIDTYRRQLQMLGFSYDWDREMATSDPSYYKWTQWIFTKLYEKGLAYEAEAYVNFCPELGTVLANEEVENGFAKEGGYPVERRPLRQWILKITAYAERLLEDLDDLDWPDYLKALQRNWIGRSEGAEIDFKIEGADAHITCFTTCAHTLFGVTYVVLSPEHPLICQIASKEQLGEVEKYVKATAHKSDLERTDLSKEKTGVFSGAYAINPLNQRKIPIWIADYVLMGYGTGAVMAVPGHDERDFAFAATYRLPMQCVIDPDLKESDVSREEVIASQVCWTGDGAMMNSSSDELSIDRLSCDEGRHKVVEYLTSHKMGRKKVNFKLRDWLFSRQRYWGEPFPILHYEDASKRVLDLDELPLTPPALTNYKPSGDGHGPLAKVSEWVQIMDPKTGKPAMRETNTMPQWAGSCWYYLRFLDPNNHEKAWGEEAEKYWMPVDMYVGGVEHAVLHLLYARFWHKVLYDLGCVSTKEPFQTLRNQGLVTAKAYKKKGGGYIEPSAVVFRDQEAYDHEGNPLVELVEKMSKSKLNGVTPDQIVDEVGADALRLYEMFMGPFDKEKLWNSDAVSGCRRFLNRFFDLVTSDKVTDEESTQGMRCAHKLVRGVSQDMEQMLFNTCISKMMEFVNEFSPLERYPKEALKMAVQVLSPFAPHLAEECWELLGETKSLSYAPFPTYDPALLQEDSLRYIVQVNGKVRGSFDLPKGQSKDALFELAKTEPRIAKYLTGSIVKVIYVPDKLMNIVVKG